MVTAPQDPDAPQPRRRSRVGEWAYRIFGPAQVDNALQGHSPEAREAWKRRVAERRRDHTKKHD